MTVGKCSRVTVSKIVKTLLQIIGIFALIIFVFSIDFGQTKATLTTADLKLIGIIILLLSLNIVVKGYRWKLLVKEISDKEISTKFGSISIVAGVSAGSVLPGRLDLAKPFMLKTKQDVPLTKSISAMVIERALDLLALVLFFLVASVFFINQTAIIISLLPIIIVIIVLIFILIVRPLWVFLCFRYLIEKMPVKKEKKSKTVSISYSFFSSFATLKKKTLIVLLTILSIVALMLEVMRLYVVFYLLDIYLSIPLVLFALSGSVLIGLIVFIPGGIGITEMSEAEIIRELGSSEISKQTDIIKSGVLLDRIFAYYSLIVIGSVILILYRFFGKNRNN